MVQRGLTVLTGTLVLALAAQAQTAPAADDAQAAAVTDLRQKGRLVLVLPFDNHSGQSNLNWIGDSFPYTLNQRLSSAGFMGLSREDRLYALQHLGLPEDFRPSRASTIKIAQTLDADYVIVGSYTVTNPGTPQSRIEVQAQVLGINQLRMSKPITQSDALSRLYEVENALAWQLARTMDPKFAVAQQTFLNAAGTIKLSAFENYIRGTTASTAEERLKRLQVAVQETPDYVPALLALGREQYADRQYESAAATLGKVPPGDRQALEGGFYRGLARFNAAKYAEAQTAFAFVASRLPLPEVVNDAGVAASRQGKDGVPLFQQAMTADPNNPDYHFNLAVGLLARSDIPGATHEVQAALKLRPDDTEAKEMLSRLEAAHGSTTNLKNVMSAGGFDPTTRIERTWSEASFRQAAFQLDQMRALVLATRPPAEQAAEYAQLGTQYLGQGLIPEAEQEFQTALTADVNNASAHAGLAEVRERTGSADEARKEAAAALKLTPSVNAYLVLARLDLQDGKMDAAVQDVTSALKLEPKNAAALAMKSTLQARGQTVP